MPAADPTKVIPGLIVAPTEPDFYRELAAVCTNEPERHGTDFLWDAANASLWGIQRKTPSDLVASIGDGRLQQELQQNGALAVSIVLIDGEFSWMSSTLEWIDNRTQRSWTRHHYDRLILSLHLRGWWVMQSSGMLHTVHMIRDIVEWSRKADHSSMLARPQQRSVWGTSTSEEWQCWMLQSIPGIGPTAARNVVQRFRGLPVDLIATREDLLAVDGIGPERADAILKAFGRPPKRRRIKKTIIPS